MKTILITGGANGLGKGIAMNYLNQGDYVIAVGNSLKNGNTFLSDAEKIGASNRATYIKANLALISENERLIKEIKNKFEKLDTLVFSATKHNKKYTETQEGIESSFALDYLSRFILSYGLKSMLENSDTPIILNITGTGMNGSVNWNDLQYKNKFKPMEVMMHGSRLNDLSGVAFNQSDTIKKIKYLLYNPMAVKTPGMSDFSNTLMKLSYKAIGKSIDDAASIINSIVDYQILENNLLVYKKTEKLDLSLETYNIDNSKKLYELTKKMLKSKSIE